MLHAKINTITKDCFVGCLEPADNPTKTCYNYYDDDNEYAYLSILKKW